MERFYHAIFYALLKYIKILNLWICQKQIVLWQGQGNMSVYLSIIAPEGGHVYESLCCLHKCPRLETTRIQIEQSQKSGIQIGWNVVLRQNPLGMGIPSFCTALSLRNMFYIFHSDGQQRPCNQRWYHGNQRGNACHRLGYTVAILSCLPLSFLF